MERGIHDLEKDRKEWSGGVVVERKCCENNSELR
jgi:hypothetical protein